jgi:hypothetical protein
MTSFKLGQLIPLGIASTHELLVLLVQLRMIQVAPEVQGRPAFAVTTYRLIYPCLDGIRRLAVGKYMVCKK